MEDVLKPREVPKNLKYEPPIEVFSAMMKNNKKAIDKIISQLEDKDLHYDQIFSGIAVQIFTLRKSIERENQNLMDLGKKSFLNELNITLNNLYRIMQEEGLEILDLTGHIVDESLLQSAEILGWLLDPREDEYVLETYEPLIKKGDRVIHAAKVTCGSKQANIEDKKLLLEAVDRNDNQQSRGY